MELRYLSPEIASLAVGRFRADGHLAWVVDQHSPFLWGPAVVSGVRVLLVDEALLEGDEAPDETCLIPTSGNLLTILIRQGVHVLLCASCLILGLALLIDLLLLIWHSPLFFAFLVLAGIFGLLGLAKLGGWLTSMFNASVLRTGQYRSLSDSLCAAVVALAILVRSLLAY